MRSGTRCSLIPKSLDHLRVKCRINHIGAVAELADAGDLKSPGSNTVWVRPPPALPDLREHSRRFLLRLGLDQMGSLNEFTPENVMEGKASQYRKKKLRNSLRCNDHCGSRAA